MNDVNSFEEAANNLLKEMIDQCESITSLEFKNKLRQKFAGPVYQRDVSNFLQNAFANDKMPDYEVTYNGTYNTYSYFENPVDTGCETCDDACDACNNDACNEEEEKPLDEQPDDSAGGFFAALKKRFLL